MNKALIALRREHWIEPLGEMNETEVGCYLSIEVGDSAVLKSNGLLAKIDHTEDHDYVGCLTLWSSKYGWNISDYIDWEATAILHGFVEGVGLYESGDAPKQAKPVVKPAVKPIIVGDATFFVNVYMDNQGRLCTPEGPLHTSMSEAKKYGKKGVDNSGWVYINSYPVNIKAKGKK